MLSNHHYEEDHRDYVGENYSSTLQNVRNGATSSIGGYYQPNLETMFAKLVVSFILLNSVTVDDAVAKKLFHKTLDLAVLPMAGFERFYLDVNPSNSLGKYETFG